MERSRARNRIIIAIFFIIMIVLVGCSGSAEQEEIGADHSPVELESTAVFDLGDHFSLDQELGEYQSWDLNLGDLDGDGDLDLFIASLGDEDPKVWFNDGSGGFTPSDQFFLVVPGESWET